ncbi:BHLH domain-containing protein [Caenorhabditis elegans]|uniref:BHLH domain-containing protein n=1 Tax=Caenorhabditis elegans TaxID=6239 RepID=Q9XX29_CAEEL|nr:BHLH domain-containing protein [Caenorhabditis elegans]CAA21011.3 BHLH domain-containing protein [Caenorhabditis elegans]
MTFEEKRKHLETTYPNKRTPESRAKSREILKLIADNLEMFPIASPESSSSKAKTDPMSRLEHGSEFNDLTVPRVEKLTPVSELYSIENTSLKFGTEDDFSDLSYSNTSPFQSVSTLYDQPSTPFSDDSDLEATPRTCVQ